MEKVKAQINTCGSLEQYAHSFKTSRKSLLGTRYRDCRERKIPASVSIHYILALLIIFGGDRWFFKILRLKGFHEFLLDYWFLYFCIVASVPFLLWGIKQTLDTLRLEALLIATSRSRG